MGLFGGETGGFAGRTGLGAVSWLFHASMMRTGLVRVKVFVWGNFGGGDILLSLGTGWERGRGKLGMGCAARRPWHPAQVRLAAGAVELELVATEGHATDGER